MDKVQLLEVDENHAGQRIDNYLMRILKGVPRSRIYRIIRKGEVRVDGKRIKPFHNLALGETVRVPPVRESSRDSKLQLNSGLARLLERSVVFEDADLIVLNKPPGIAVHGGSGVRQGLIETLRLMRPDDKYLELVHRLDKETSGCLMIARKKSKLTHLHDLLRRNALGKDYVLLVQGRWPRPLRQVDAPLLKNELKGGERIVRVARNGKAASTEFKIVREYEDCTLMIAKPRTGRTHQIRVHALHAGHAIVGDDRYGDTAFNRQMRIKGLKRLFLHAYRLRVPAETEGRITEFITMPGKDFMLTNHDESVLIGEQTDK